MTRRIIIAIVALLASIVFTKDAHAVYQAEMGQFLQRDPNGFAQAILDDQALHGNSILQMAMRPDIQRTYRDGGKLNQYCGSNPVMNSDPMGLEFSLGGLMVVQGAQAWLDASGTLEEARQGIVTFGGLYDMIRGYSFWQEYDVDWAADWSASDDGYSGSASFAESWEQDQDTGPAMAGIRGPGKMSKAISRAARISKLAKPSPQKVQRGIQEAQKLVGSHRRGPNNSLPKDNPHGGPTWQSEDGLRGYRLEPPHPSGNHSTRGWHINWYDWSGGKRGTGGLRGDIPLD